MGSAGLVSFWRNMKLFSKQDENGEVLPHMTCRNSSRYYLAIDTLSSLSTYDPLNPLKHMKELRYFKHIKFLKRNGTIDAAAK